MGGRHHSFIPGGSPMPGNRGRGGDLAPPKGPWPRRCLAFSIAFFRLFPLCVASTPRSKNVSFLTDPNHAVVFGPSSKPRWVSPHSLGSRARLRNRILARSRSLITRSSRNGCSPCLENQCLGPGARGGAPGPRRRFPNACFGFAATGRPAGAGAATFELLLARSVTHSCGSVFKCLRRTHPPWRMWGSAPGPSRL